MHGFPLRTAGVSIPRELIPSHTWASQYLQELVTHMNSLLNREHESRVGLSGEGVEPVVWERWLSRRATDAAELNIQLARSILQGIRLKNKKDPLWRTWGSRTQRAGHAEQQDVRWRRKCESRWILVERSKIQSLYSSWTPRETYEILDATSFVNSTFLNFLHSTLPPNATHSCYLEVVILT